MDMRRVFFLFAALVIAGGTAFFARTWLTSERAAAVQVARPDPVPQRPPALQVLVARGDLRTGQIIRPDDLRWQVWPEGTMAPTYIVEGRRPLSDFVGAVARGPVSAGEPITEGRVVLPGSRGFMAAVLTPGMRAVSVPVTATSGISGFVFAGDRVDLLLTHKLPSASGEERHAAETILRDVRVIGLDQRLDSKPGDPAQVAKTATLEVTAKQSEVIALAVEMGKLSMSLRSLQESVDGEASGEAADIVVGPDGQPTVQAVSFTRDDQISRLLAPPGTAKEGVTVFRGNAQASGGKK